GCTPVSQFGLGVNGTGLNETLAAIVTSTTAPVAGPTPPTCDYGAITTAITMALMTTAMSPTITNVGLICT
uniref:Uncharacterized protein n=1 Tax=Acrobeloides nanus TaxID=290746 RepID=A0A914CII0_9BILA